MQHEVVICRYACRHAFYRPHLAHGWKAGSAQAGAATTTAAPACADHLQKEVIQSPRVSSS